MKKFFLIFSFLTILSCSTFRKDYHIYIDREKYQVYVMRNDETVFETKTKYWDIKGDYITEVLTSGNEINICLYDCIKNEITEYPFDATIDLKGNVIYRLHQRAFINHQFSLLPDSKTLFFSFAYEKKPGIYSLDLKTEGSLINLIYPTHEDIRFIDVSEEYLCFISYFDSLWVKSLRNDSLYGNCLSNTCEAIATGSSSSLSNTNPTGFLLIRPNKLLVELSNENFYILDLKDLAKMDFKSSLNLSYRGNCFSDGKLYYFTEQLGKKRSVVNKISFNSLDLDSYEIDSNIYEISKPRDYYSIYVNFYSIDKENRLHLYLSKTKISADKHKEYEWFDYIIYDLKKRKIISKEENLNKIERYLLK